MKKILRALALFVGVFLVVSCSKVKQVEPKPSFVMENGMLVGQIEKTDLQKAPFTDWYKDNYKWHEVNRDLVNSFKNELKDFDIEIFMGTWCGDSHREVPAFYKILEIAKYPEDKVKTFAVNRKKETGWKFEENKNITHVPTFIFYKNGKEVGRIVESPINSLEEDIRDIVDGNPQTPNYN
ncbi:thioredoxin family protein [Weeksellaceae bacterium TAE3-ERU29]|nr:thioredoxin family protein [Weeksellaceae bacterium TAE3-ERU29]